MATTNAVEDIVAEFIDDLIFEVAIEMKWLIKTKQVTIEDVYKIKPPPSLKCKPQITALPDKSSSDGIHAITSSGAASRFVSCNVCGKDIVGSRFAPHLERCMNGGSRTTTGGFDLLPDTVKEKVKKEPVDPHPTSMVIRIKMRNGAPVTKNRIGVSYEEFLLHKKDPS